MESQSPTSHNVPDLEALDRLAASFVEGLRLPDVVCLSGPLGAGKTTFVRACLRALGYSAAVKSPTFNLIQTFDTTPPVLHADLYRLANATGFGLEELLETHLSFVEWPDRLAGMLDPDEVYWVEIDFAGEGRTFRITPPFEPRSTVQVESN